MDMCKAWDDMITENQAKGLEEGLEKGLEKAIQRMIRKGYSKEAILELEYTEEEYSKAAAALSNM